jgi:hypothetical protein
MAQNITSPENKTSMYAGLVVAAIVLSLVAFNWTSIKNAVMSIIGPPPSVPVVVITVPSPPVPPPPVPDQISITEGQATSIVCPADRKLQISNPLYYSTVNGPKSEKPCGAEISLDKVNGNNMYTFGPDLNLLDKDTCPKEAKTLSFGYLCV